MTAFAIVLGTALLGAGPGPCPDGTVFVEERRIETAEATYIQPVCRRIQPTRGQSAAAARRSIYAPGFVNEQDFVRAMARLARSLRFSGDEVGRVDRALAALPRTDVPPATIAAIAAIWTRMERRSSDAELAAVADRARGADLFSAGWQSGDYSDCAIFALATASAVPYGIVAARANDLLRSAPWRNQADRDRPEQVFKTGGLNGGEVILLAEALGQVAIFEQSQFAATVAAGRPLLVSLTTRGGTAHQVVLSRAFRHRGSNWYEVIDSQAEPSRTYLSHEELFVLAEENGIGLAPDAQVPLLRN